MLTEAFESTSEELRKVSVSIDRFIDIRVWLFHLRAFYVRKLQSIFPVENADEQWKFAHNIVTLQIRIR